MASAAGAVGRSGLGGRSFGGGRRPAASRRPARAGVASAAGAVSAGVASAVGGLSGRRLRSGRGLGGGRLGWPPPRCGRSPRSRPRRASLRRPGPQPVGACGLGRGGLGGGRRLGGGVASAATSARAPRRLASAAGVPRPAWRRRSPRARRASAAWPRRRAPRRWRRRWPRARACRRLASAAGASAVASAAASGAGTRRVGLGGGAPRGRVGGGLGAGVLGRLRLGGGRLDRGGLLRRDLVGLARRRLRRARGVGGDGGLGGRVLHAHGRGRVAVPLGGRRRFGLRRRGGLVLVLRGGRLGHGVGPLAAGWSARRVRRSERAREGGASGRGKAPGSRVASIAADDPRPGTRSPPDDD